MLHCTVQRNHTEQLLRLFLWTILISILHYTKTKQNETKSIYILLFFFLYTSTLNVFGLLVVFFFVAYFVTHASYFEIHQSHNQTKFVSQQHRKPEETTKYCAIAAEQRRTYKFVKEEKLNNKFSYVFSSSSFLRSFAHFVHTSLIFVCVFFFPFFLYILLFLFRFWKIDLSQHLI